MARKSRTQAPKPRLHVEQTLDLPEILKPDVPHIEMQGNGELIIDGCKGILEYTEDRIKLHAGALILSVLGSNLTIRMYAESQTMIIGDILQIEFEN